MMRNRWVKLSIFAAVMMLLCAGLCGCAKLAQKPLQEITGGEKLIGVFITDNADLKDFQMQEGDTLYYSEKKLVRADGSVRKLSDEEIKNFEEGFIAEGKKNPDNTYSFAHVQGYYFGGEAQEKEEDGDFYQDMHVYSSEGIYDCNTAVNLKGDAEGNDSEQEIEFSAKVILPSFKEFKLRVGAVYMRADGSVYTRLPGDSAVLIPKGDTGGYGHRIAESNEASMNGTGIKGKKTKETIAFSIQTESVDSLKSAKIMQMNKSNQTIKTDEGEFFHKEQFLKLEEDTAYVIIEENLVNAEGKSYTKRTSYDCEDQGYDDNEGHQIIDTHMFKYTDENGRIKLIDVSFER